MELQRKGCEMSLWGEWSRLCDWKYCSWDWSALGWVYTCKGIVVCGAGGACVQGEVGGGVPVYPVWGQGCMSVGVTWGCGAWR